MKHEIDLIEIYIPECIPHSPGIMPGLDKLSGWDFLLNRAKQENQTSEWDSVLSQYFFSQSTQDIPHAALCAYLNDLENTQQKYWIKADPIHCMLDRNHGYIYPAEISPSDVQAINNFIKQDGLKFWIIDSHNALISSDKPINYHAPSLIDIIQQPLSFEKITGEDKAYWQKLNSELQLLLKQYKKTETDPDGVYFYGAGERPKNKINIPFDKVFSDNDSVLGLAKLGNVAFQKIDLNTQINVELENNKAILIMAQNFSLYWRAGNLEAYQKWVVYFNKFLAQLIDVIQAGRLKKLILNTGNKKYELTKKSIFIAEFLKHFKHKKAYN